MRISVIGAGYVGAVSAAVLAYLGNDVTCVERDAERLAAWRGRTDPLRERGLEDLLRQVDVHFTSEAGDVGEADVILVAVGTPMGRDGRPDLDQLETAAAQIGARARPGAVVLVRSTVPVGTCDRLQDGPLRAQLVVSNPEFLREGDALRDSFVPDRIVAGGPPEAKRVVADLYARVIDRSGLPRDLSRDERAKGPVPFCWMSAASAELAKYAANGFLATK